MHPYISSRIEDLEADLKHRPGISNENKAILSLLVELTEAIDRMFENATNPCDNFFYQEAKEDIEKCRCKILSI